MVGLGGNVTLAVLVGRLERADTGVSVGIGATVWDGGGLVDVDTSVFVGNRVADRVALASDSVVASKLVVGLQPANNQMISMM